MRSWLRRRNDSHLFALLAEPKHGALPADQTEEEGRSLPLSLSDSCAAAKVVHQSEGDGGMAMEEGGVKCWLSASVLLSGALSGAFFFSLLLSSDSKMI